MGGDSFTIGAALAACIQLGYADVLLFNIVSKFNFSRAGEGTPIAFGKVNCHSGFEALHILRCNTSSPI